MRAVIEIALAIAFLVGSGAGANKLYYSIKTESLLKVQKGLAPLSSFIKKLTQK